MSPLLRVLLASALLVPLLGAVGSSLAVAAACDPTGVDASAIAAARSAIDQACDCEGAANHRSYVACARRVVVDLVSSGQLPRGCRGIVRKCSARSICGRPGAVTCCRTKANGITKGFVKKSAEACRAPRGGAACVGGAASVCDSCTADGCAAVCGNGTVESGEACEPPGTASCDADCQHIPACGDGTLDAGEACDGDAGQCFGFSCGTSSEPLACQCCGRSDTIFFVISPDIPCCDGSSCRPYGPGVCTCDPNSCLPSGGFCGGQVPCCTGLVCNGIVCE